MRHPDEVGRVPQGRAGAVPSAAGPGTAGFGGPPPRRTGRVVLWVVLASVAFVVLSAVGVGLVVVRVLGAGVGEDDDALAGLEEACAGGDWTACDDLYFQAPAGSELEEFGRTCGGVTDGARLCATELGFEAVAYGDDPELDALWDACEAGDGVACDDLFRRSPVGSEYETFGGTCGGLTEGGMSCSGGTVQQSSAGGGEGAWPAVPLSGTVREVLSAAGVQCPSCA
jgi:hypothetical protein